MAANREAFNRVQLIPRMLNNVEERYLELSLFGQPFSAPLFLAPVGVQTIAHPEGELATARAAKKVGLPYIASTASSYSLEAIASELGDHPHWFQLYWGKDPEVTASFLKRAEKAKYSAIVVTLDTIMLSWREKDLEKGYLPFLEAKGIANYLSDPVFRSRLKAPPEEDLQSAVAQFLATFSNAALTWEDLSFLRTHTSLPIILKGILHPEDARKALDAGVDGLIVSNHGGRQVDGAIASIVALDAILEGVKNEIPVLLDSGIRRGADVIKALALGASAVLVGRPYIYGLAVGGEEGAKHVLESLLADVDLTLGLTGHASIVELNKSLLKFT
jgi:isopentenyl diphosphate isomerase/L-lactate dehydrogenase-like FMN-dependent dehydrogenase